ncbi:hypothetical protein AK812_SmicGene25213 [Symbiodinium microadriaticum]|uniref:Uncharacterized protein n=1 Tax=Symbiodinium microadriaticum TaxID=2951 RepID=A0A1Q9DCQ1_SYMMI|nr:hypothetical protein AK812_SmicGene25213 [Symbiodinium microadriaticum]
MFFLLLTLCLSETGWVGLLLGWEGLVGWAGLGGWADLGLGWTLGWSSIIGELKAALEKMPPSASVSSEVIKKDMQTVEGAASYANTPIFEYARLEDPFHFSKVALFR